MLMVDGDAIPRESEARGAGREKRVNCHVDAKYPTDPFLVLLTAHLQRHNQTTTKNTSRRRDHWNKQHRAIGKAQ
jgi:hypothetical protein